MYAMLSTLARHLDEIIVIAGRFPVEQVVRVNAGQNPESSDFN